MKVVLHMAALAGICAVYLSCAGPSSRAKPNPFFHNDPRLPGTYCLLYFETNGFIADLDWICKEVYATRGRKPKPETYFEGMLRAGALGFPFLGPQRHAFAFGIDMGHLGLELGPENCFGTVGLPLWQQRRITYCFSGAQ